MGWPDRLIGYLWVAILVAIPLLFNPYSRRVFEPEKVSLLRFLSILVAAVWVWGSVRTWAGQSRGWLASFGGRPRTVVLIFTGCLVLVYLAATVASIAPRISWSGSYEWRHGAYTFLVCLIVFLSILCHRRAVMWLGSWVSAIEATSVVVAGYGILQYSQLDPVPWQRVIEGRAFSTLSHPNFLAAYLVLVIPLPVACLLSSTGWRERCLHAAVLIIDAFCLLLTFSRSGWLGLLAAAGCFALLKGKLSPFPHRWVTAIAVILVGLGLFSALAYLDPRGAFSYSPLEPLHSFLRGKSATAQVRSLMWGSSWQLVKARPWLGFGPETFRLSFPRAYPPGLTLYGGATATGDHAHNEWLDWALETGALGVGAYVGLLLAALSAGVRSLSQVTNRRQRMLLVGLLAGVVGYLAQNQLSFATIAPFIYFWMFLGMIVAIAAQVTSSPLPVDVLLEPVAGEEREKGPSGLLFTLLVAAFTVAGLVFLTMPDVRALVADVHARLGEEAVKSGDWAEAVRQYQEAIRLSPTQDRYLDWLSNNGRALALNSESGRSAGFTMAEAAVRKAIELSPGDASYWVSLGELYYEWGVSGQVDKLDVALDAYRHAAGMSPSDPEILSRWGRVYHALGKYNAAMEMYQKALDLDPLNVEAYTSLGEAYLALGNVPAAEATYAKIDQVTETIDRLVSKR